MNVVGWIVLSNLKWLILIAVITVTLYFTLAPNETSGDTTPVPVTTSPTFAPEPLSPTSRPDTASPTNNPTSLSVSGALSSAPSFENISSVSPSSLPTSAATETLPPTSATPASNNPTLTPTPEIPVVPELEYVGEFNTNSSLFPLGMCKADCDKDKHCQIGLSCFKRLKQADVPGCVGDAKSGVDFCYKPPPGVLVIVARNRKSSSLFPLDACRGRCRRDSDCKDDLICYTRKGDERIPGCEGDGVVSSSYCALAPANPPTNAIAKTSPPTVGAVPPNNNEFRIAPECSPSSPCEKCQGDCKADNSNCRQDLGLECFKRTNQEKVFGCAGGGEGDVGGVDFCYKPQPALKGMTYVPGEATVIESGLLLSTGLTAKCIATSGEKVEYFDGGESEEEFHVDPDAAAVFKDEETGGWIYVSNAESGKYGGVGAITFNSDGEVKSYSILTKETRRNCGGGKTFWNTFLSCEETEGGQIWEIDPWGNRAARKTILGIDDGDEYESAAYDNRNRNNPKFFVTVDTKEGAIIKFEPDTKAVQEALSTDPPDYSNLLHTNETGTATREFLLIQPKSEDEENKGTYSWTSDLDKARKNAKEYYQSCEGIDVRKGTLFFTCKREKVLFILNLDDGTYERESTKSGAFENGPDQVARLLGKDGDILYFCEDGGKENVCGVHGRDKNGKFYSILESNDPEYIGETSGLAFSPDNMYMYVSFQQIGKIFQVSRTDGYPFGGQRLDIKYHSNQKNLFEFPTEER